MNNVGNCGVSCRQEIDLHPTHMGSIVFQLADSATFVMSDNLNARSDLDISTVSFLLFTQRAIKVICTNQHTQSSWCKEGKLLRFYLPGASCSKQSQVLHHKEHSFKYSAESPSLALLASGGCFALWIQTSCRSGSTSIMKLHCDTRTDNDLVENILVHSRPLLPFDPENSTAFAFDDSSGRLCICLFNGTIYLIQL